LQVVQRPCNHATILSGQDHASLRHLFVAICDV